MMSYKLSFVTTNHAYACGLATILNEKLLPATNYLRAPN